MASDILQCTVRSAASVEEAFALWWPQMKELGWNRAEDDAKTHFHVTQNGKNWLLLFPNSSSKPEGCVVAFTYPNGTGWVAFFIMSATYRGQGLGRQLWKEMENTFQADGTSVIGLDGVQEQVETYKRRGFEDTARIPLMVRDSLKQKPFDVELGPSETVELVDLRDVDPKELARLDFEHTGLDRAAYWASDVLPSRTHSYGFAIFSGSRLTGFVYVRRCELGHRVGPLYAETYAHARQLLYQAVNYTAGSDGSYIAEIFGTNDAGQKVFEELGWTYADISYHRMWLHGNVPKEQQEGGKGASGMYAIFDACAG